MCIIYMLQSISKLLAGQIKVKHSGMNPLWPRLYFKAICKEKKKRLKHSYFNK